MQTNTARSVTNKTRGAFGVVVALALATLAGCSGNPGPGSTAYKEGELGNGDFLFTCDDGVACLPYSGDAKRFPTAIATGSTFDVRFVANDDQGVDLDVNERNFNGLKATALPPYVSEGPDGFLAKQAGYGTIIVRDSGNTVVDYVTLKIVKPDALVVYDANYDVSFGKEPQKLQALNMKVDATATYRVVAEYNRESIAGSIPVDWTSDDSETVLVESYSRRVVTLRAKKAGTTTLTASGGGIDKKLTVEVKP